MVSKEALEAMAQAGISGADPGSLPDLSAVEIRGGTPAERLESLLAQVENPYCFRVGKTPVKIRFCGDKSINTQLKSHLLALKRGGVPGKKRQSQHVIQKGEKGGSP